MKAHRFVPFLSAVLAALAPVSFAASQGDQEFVLKAAQGGHAEVKAGNLAKTKAADPGVKEFGEMMVKDHSMAGKELEDIAKANSIGFPADTDAMHQQMLDRIAALEGRAFDQAYIDEMVSGHRKMEELLDSMSKKAENAQLKDWAKRTLPKVKTHLQKAEGLKSKLH